MRFIKNSVLFGCILLTILGIYILVPASPVSAQVHADGTCAGYIYTTYCYTECGARTLNCPFPGTQEGYGFLCLRKTLYIFQNGQRVVSDAGSTCDYDGQPTCYSTCY